MASHCHQLNVINFYLIILKSSLLKLRIPNKFTKKYGFTLSNPVSLKPPDGTEWKVYWTTHDGDIWFQSGWEKFVRYYSLDEGHLVLFKYKETSGFDVLLFDKSNLEIDYPFHSLDDEKENIDQFSDDSVEILDEIPPHQKAGPKSRSLSPRPHKKLRSGTNGDAENSSNLKNLHMHVPTKGSEFQCTKFEKSINGNVDMKSTKKGLEEGIGASIFTDRKFPNFEQNTWMKPLTATQRTEAFKRASTFRSENPFFIVTMPLSYVSKSTMNIPAQFAEQYLKENEAVVLLQVFDGRTWSAIYKFPKIKAGWKEFVIDNNLKVGDVCVFELIRSSSLMFKVLIFPVPEDQSCSFLRDDGNRSSRILKGSGGIPTSRKCNPEVSGGMQIPNESKAFERAKSYKSQNPFFKVALKKSYVHGKANLHVPLEFANKYFSFEMSPRLITLKREDGRLWFVRHNCKKSGKYHKHEFLRGWKKFVLDNDLQIGDVCVFELIDIIELTLVVTIFRSTEHPAHSEYPAQSSVANQAESERIPDIETKANCTSNVKLETSLLSDRLRSKLSYCPLRKAEVESSAKAIKRTSSSSLNKHRVTGALEETETFNSENPFFKVHIRPSYVLNNTPSVPKAFLSIYITEREKNGQIQLGEKTWPMKLLCYPHLTSGKLSAGWPSFARENNLRDGDVCVFELINKEDAVLKAHIFRCLS